jgi:hypothetical protein
LFVKEVGSGIVVYIFQRAHPVKLNLVLLQDVLLVAVVEVKKIKQRDISFLVID